MDVQMDSSVHRPAATWAIVSRRTPEAPRARVARALEERAQVELVERRAQPVLAGRAERIPAAREPPEARAAQAARAPQERAARLARSPGHPEPLARRRVTPPQRTKAAVVAFRVNAPAPIHAALSRCSGQRSWAGDAGAPRHAKSLRRSKNYPRACEASRPRVCGPRRRFDTSRFRRSMPTPPSPPSSSELFTSPECGVAG